MKIRFNEPQKNTIFAYTIKDKKGNEITGTNTALEGLGDIAGEQNQVYEISFRQNAIMQGGEYLISFGCTVFEGDNLAVNHRLYDATYLTILSEINTIGFFDIGSKADIKLLEE